MTRTLPAAVLFSLLLLCGASSAGAVTEIRLWHAMSGAAGEELEALVKRFNASQQEYVVVPAYKGNYEQTLEETLKASGAGAPHVAQIYEVGTADMMEKKGLVNPLYHALAESGVHLTAKFLPPVSGYFSDPKGRLLAMPFNTSTPVLYVNRDAVAKAKLDPSQPLRTWYDGPAALGAIVESGSQCALTTTHPSWVLLENMSAWHNQEFATHHNGMDGSGARLSFNSHLMVRWISILQTWNRSGYFTYAGRGNEAEARFASGECALLMASSSSFADLKKIAKFDIGVAQLPYYDDISGAPHHTLVGGAGLWVLAGKPKAETRGAAKFLAWLVQPEVQAEWHQKTGYVPVTTQAYELTRQSGYYKTSPGYEIAVRQLLGKQPTKASAGIRLHDFRQIRAIVHEEIEAVWDMKKTPLEALNTSVSRGNAVLAKHGPEQAEKPQRKAAPRKPAAKKAM